MADPKEKAEEPSEGKPEHPYNPVDKAKLHPAKGEKLKPERHAEMARVPQESFGHK